MRSSIMGASITVQTSETLAQQNSEAEHWKSKTLRQRLKRVSCPIKTSLAFQEMAAHTLSALHLQ